MLKRLFAKKKIENGNEEEEGQPKLKRHLDAFHLTSIGIGAIIGAGIFVITGEASAEYAGPAIVLSFIIAAIVCVFAGLCYAELASLIPISGGAYSYSYVAFGEFIAWLVGWGIILQYLGSACTVAVGFSGYFVSFFKSLGFHLTETLTRAPLNYDVDSGWQLSGSILNIPALCLCALIGFFILIGIKAAARLNNAMVAIKLITILLFIVFGVFYINPSNWIPFIPENTGFFGSFGWSGVLRAAGFVFFAYNGFDSVATLAQEAVNPQKDIPKGILGSLAVSTLAYVSLTLVLTGIVSYSLLNVPDPMSVALNAMGPNFVWFGLLVKLAILAALASVILVQFLGQTRIFFSMSQDGLLPKAFRYIHPTFQTPVYSTLITMGVAIVISALFPVDLLAQLVSLATLMIFTIACTGVLLLRYTHPEAPRGFKVPFMPWIPLLGIVCCVAQMLFMPMVTWLQFIGWMLLGLIIYFAYGIRKSNLNRL